MYATVFTFDPPEISDQELGRLEQDGIRQNVETLLRDKRIGALPAYQELLAIRDSIGERIKEISIRRIVQRDEPGNLGAHLEVKGTIARWRNLEAVVISQLDWMRRQVKVDQEEVYHLVNRYLLLRFVEPSIEQRQAQGLPV